MTSTHSDDTMTTPVPGPRPADPGVPALPWVTGTPSEPGTTHATGPTDATGPTEDAERRAEVAERRLEALERALTTRAGIDQAKGAIMATFALTAESAFEVLIWVSQHSNVKLAVVADRFLEELHALDLGQPPRDQLTRVLATLAGCDPTAATGPGGG